MIIEIR